MRESLNDAFRSMVRARNLVNLLLVLLLVAAADVTIPSPAAAVSLGSYPGLTALAPNDDSSSGAVPLGFTLSFFGHDYSSVYVNNNGNVTFDSPQSTYTPYGLSSTTRVIIAPFFADVDTRAGGTVSYGTIDYGGRVAFCVQWKDVGYYGSHNDKTNSFELILVDRSDVSRGDFDAIFRYERIQWETGDASGGSGGFGGASATVGYASGSGVTGTFFDQEGSGVNGSFLDSGPNALVSAGSPPGVLLFHWEPGSLAAPIVPSLPSVPTRKPTVVLIGGLWSDYHGSSSYARDIPDSNNGWSSLYTSLWSSHFNVLIPPMSNGNPSDNTMDSSSGYLVDNWKRLDTWLSEHLPANNKSIVLVGHSMGGLISRGFAESFFTRPKSGAKVVGIYQIDTPNLGSPMSAIGRWLITPWASAESVSVEQLDKDGPTIRYFNSKVAPKTTVYTRHISSDFFPNSALKPVPGNPFTPTWSQVVFTRGLDAMFGDEPNDGLVSLSSAVFTPPGDRTNDGGLVVHAVHGRGIPVLSSRWLLLWPDADCMPPDSGAVGWPVIKDIAQFTNRAFGRAGLVAKPATTSTSSLARVAAASDSPAELSPTDLDSAGGSTTSAKGDLSLSSASSGLVPFSVEGTGALVNVASESGSPTISITRQGGATVDSQTTSSSGLAMGTLSCSPGDYFAHVGLTGATAADASLDVIDAGPTELRVSAPDQVEASSAFTVQAAVYEDDVRQAGGVFTASVAAAAVILHDDGLAPDSVAGDGAFSGTLTAPAIGTTDVVVQASGVDAEGVAYTRVAHQLVSVAVPRATLTGPYTWRTTTGTSGKADALLFDVGVHASQDCSLQVAGTVTSGGNTVAQPSTVVTLTAGSDATVTLAVTPEEIQSFDASGDFSLSSVELLDMTDTTLTSIDSAAPALTGTLAPADVEYAACTVGLEGAAPTNAVTTELTGEAVSTTAAIGGVELSFDDGTTWYQAPEPDAGWGSNDVTWICAFTLPEGDFGVISQALDANGDPIPGAKGQCSFTVDRTAPATTATVDPTGWSKQATITLAVDDGTGSGVSQTLYSIDGGAEEVYSGPFTVATEGAQVSFSSIDLAGNQEATQTVSPQVDATAPTTSATGADADWHNAPVTVTFTAADNDGGSGMSGGSAKTEYKLDSGDWTTGTSVTVPAPADHSGDGEHTLSYRSTDAAGNSGAAKSVTVKIDTTTPGGSFALSGGAATTTVTAVSGDSSVTDAHGPLAMRFSLDDKASWSDWEDYAATKALTLPDGIGSKTVYAQYRDAAGNVSEISDTIQLVATPDTTPPTTIAAGVDALWHNASVTVTLTPSDNAGGSGMSGGLAKTEYKLDAGGWTEGTSVTVPAPVDHSRDGEHTVSYRSTDNAGNLEEPKSVTVKIDTIAPSGSFTLSGGAATTTTTAVSGNSSVTDAHGPLAMRFSTDVKASWSDWEDYAATKALTLPDGLGAKTVYAQYRDAAGNVLELSDAIELIVAPPLDTTDPTVAATGVSPGAWLRSAALVMLSATDEVGGSGVLSITYVLDGGLPQTMIASSVPVGVPLLPNAAHTLVYRATDVAGNTCADKTLSFTTDSVGPVTAGKATSGRKGRAIALRYKLADNLSPQAKAVKLIVKTSRGKKVKSFSLGTKKTAAWYSVKWKPKAKGTYRYYVYGKDLAGNAQRRVGSARVVVR